MNLLVKIIERIIMNTPQVTGPVFWTPTIVRYSVSHLLWAVSTGVEETGSHTLSHGLRVHSVVL